MNKKDYEYALSRFMGKLGTQDHTSQELDEMVRKMPVGVMQDATSLALFCVGKRLSLRDSLAIIAWVATQFQFLTDIKVKSDISYNDAVEYYRTAQIHTIVLHRVNYYLHECMVRLYDILDDSGRMMFAVKKTVKETERHWDDYVSVRHKNTEETAWYTLQDHLRLACDAVWPYIEKVYEAIRDNMIYLGFRDVEVRAWCVIVLLMGKVTGHTYKRFFDDFEEECGANFSLCFDGDDMQPMMKNFSVLCDRLGLPTEKDKLGYYVAKDYDPEKNARFRKAWDDLMNNARNDDLMDEMAKKAIDLNPSAKEEYYDILNEAEKKNAIEELGRKYKIGKL